MRLDAIVYRAFTSRGGARGKASRAQGGVKALVLGAILLAAPACATSSYMGISMNPGEASPEVQALAQRAQRGDKQAQLDLGIRFEEGNGVPQDKARAVKLYRQATSDSGGTIWVYAPSPGNGAPARVMPVDRGPRQQGLDEAKARLDTKPTSTADQSSSRTRLEDKIKSFFLKITNSQYEFERETSKMVLSSEEYERNHVKFDYSCGHIREMEAAVSKICLHGKKIKYFEEILYSYKDINAGYYGNCRVNKNDFYKLDELFIRKAHSAFLDRIKSGNEYADASVGTTSVEFNIGDNLITLEFSNSSGCLVRSRIFFNHPLFGDATD